MVIAAHAGMLMGPIFFHQLKQADRPAAMLAARNDRPMRFLIISNNYPVEPDSSNMQTDLAAELIKHGHHVDVAVQGWCMPDIKRVTQLRTEAGANVTIFPAFSITSFGRLFERLTRWALLPWRVGRSFRRLFDTTNYDVVLVWTPCVLVRSAFRYAQAHSKARSVLYIADFFPIHHAELGLVPRGPVYALAKAMEEKLFRRFDIIFCNLPSNIGYLRTHYRVRPQQDVRWTPLWVPTTEIRRRPRAQMRASYDLPQGVPIAVFGGQIIEGRGVEQMLEAAARSREAGLSIHFLFIGDGRLEPMVKEAAGRPGSNVIHRSAVPREEFLSILTACDVGMLATVPGVSSHSFPTKSMDYLRAGLPVVAAVEPGSDFARMITDHRVGASVALGDDKAMYEAIESFACDPSSREEMQDRARGFVEAELDVIHCYRRLIDALEGRPAS